MKRKVALMLLALLLAGIAFLAWFGPVESGVPSFESASVGIHGSGEGEAMRLSFAQQEWLHDLVSGIPRDRSPKKWQVFCTVRLFDAAGRQVSQIEVYRNPGGSGPLRIGENYFLGYDQAAFLEMLALRTDPPESPR